MSTHQLQLLPTDVLFFKDGRPMDGSSSGHGAAWPLPHVIDAALHAALHRSGKASHSHTPKQSGKEDSRDRTRRFGSLQSAGPFPVSKSEKWFFPRPADADLAGSSETTHQPFSENPPGAINNLPGKLFPVVNSQPPNKEQAEKWLNKEAYQAYLNHDDLFPPTKSDEDEKVIGHFIQDEEIFAAEHNIGIGIDPTTDTQDGERLYSASYLRLQTDWTLGLLAHCKDKGPQGDTDTTATADLDLIAKVFPNAGAQTHIIAGGQQRTATVLRTTPNKLPLPVGKSDDFPEHNGKYLLRWTLLSPAIFPHIPKDEARGILAHSGGWLPNWISAQDLQVQLLDGPGKNAVRRRGGDAGKRIEATLIAAMVPRPIPVTGWSLGQADKEFGAKSTHLAVPAGSVYYFACDSQDAARKLAAALNWHSTSNGTEIQNRRSTILGEKGYGLGVCSAFSFHSSQK